MGLIEKVAIVGAGIMGSNIGLAVALGKVKVSITEQDAGRLSRAESEICANAELWHLSDRGGTG